MSVQQRSKAIILVAVVLAALLLTIAGIVIFRRVPSGGTIIALGCQVYSDSTLTKVVTMVNWGYVEPGKEYSRTVYVKNTGNYPVNLTLGTDNWNPAIANQTLTLFWNYDNRTLLAGQAIPVVFTLAVASDTKGVTAFTFNIVIIAWAKPPISGASYDYGPHYGEPCLDLRMKEEAKLYARS